ncbi:hypothetical protein LuPra_02430 [Luteitalea pratensis]|uniref:Uncharacterized protein n=2 Tax=Luteitalea pratensis TaxID=1855912 RepID=A0A143PKZ0_LUTPR|nr:hypothetical protein LuPra_02430 [Luteitalea pratensis]
MLAGVSLVAAEPAYVGKWKFNAARSQLTGDTVTISSGADGTMTFDGQGFKYSFKVDGKEYPTPDGSRASWTQPEPDAWDVTIKAGGKLLVGYRAVVKGETMRLAGKLTKPDGTTSDFTVAYKRTAGGPGLVGKWTSTEVTMPVSLLEVAAVAPDGVTITDDTGAVFSGQFDGTAAPGLGRLKGSKYTTIFRKTGANGFEMRTSVDGQPMYAEVYSVSADGKTLTIDGTPVNAPTEKYKVVFDRQ